MASLNDPITTQFALEIAGATFALIVGFCCALYVQVIAKSDSRIEEAGRLLQIRVSAIEVSEAKKSGNELPDRVGKLEPSVRSLEIDVAVLKASEAERSTRLAQGLADLQRVIDLLQEDIKKGDLESKISSAQALVKASQAVVTLAKLQSSDAQDRASAELRLAEETLVDLLKKRTS